MRNYTPRKAGKRWLDGAPHYVLDCFDNPKENDRYTVIFGKQFMNDGGSSGQWLSLIDLTAGGAWSGSEYQAHVIAAYRYRNGHHRMRWQDLPKAVRDSVKRWAEQD